MVAFTIIAILLTVLLIVDIPETDCMWLADRSLTFDYPVEVHVCRTRESMDQPWSEWSANGVRRGTTEDVYLLNADLPQ
jgi:hypothetical protein